MRFRRERETKKMIRFGEGFVILKTLEAFGAKIYGDGDRGVETLEGFDGEGLRLARREAVGAVSRYLYGLRNLFEKKMVFLPVKNVEKSGDSSRKGQTSFSYVYIYFLNGLCLLFFFFIKSVYVAICRNFCIHELRHITTYALLVLARICFFSCILFFLLPLSTK